MREIPLLNDEYYHIFNRGVDHRSIFIDDIDREHFLRGLHVLNDRERASNIPFTKDFPTQQPYATIAAYCLMPNHFHLILRQMVENGISLFLKRLLGSHVRYFNTRHGRDGRLFTNSFRNVHISTNEQLMATLRYIHLNPLDLLSEEQNQMNVNAFLDYYPWSSHRHYLKNTTSNIINDEIASTIPTVEYRALGFS